MQLKDYLNRRKVWDAETYQYPLLIRTEAPFVNGHPVEKGIRIARSQF